MGGNRAAAGADFDFVRDALQDQAWQDADAGDRANGEEDALDVVVRLEEILDHLVVIAVDIGCMLIVLPSKFLENIGFPDLACTKEDKRLPVTSVPPFEKVLHDSSFHTSGLF